MHNFENLEFSSVESYLKEMRDHAAKLRKAILNHRVDTPLVLEEILMRAAEAELKVFLSAHHDVVRRTPFGILFSGPSAIRNPSGFMLASSIYNHHHGRSPSPNDILSFDMIKDSLSNFHSIDNINLARRVVLFIKSFFSVCPLQPHSIPKKLFSSPEVVVATMDRFIPTVGMNTSHISSSRHHLNTSFDFSVRIWQIGSDQFYIIDDFISRKESMDNSLRNVHKLLTWEQLLQRLLVLYKIHQSDQAERDEVYEASVRPEGFTKSACIFSAITTLQAVARLVISLKAREGDDIFASLLIALRRFVALPLQNLKNDAQSEISQFLLNVGMTRRDAHHAKLILEKICKFGPSCYRAKVSKEDLLNLRGAIDMISPVLEVYLLKKITRPLSYHIGSLYYDILSLFLPKITRLIMDKLPSYHVMDQYTLEVRAEGKLEFKSLYHLYAIDWVLAVLENHMIDKFKTIELFDGEFIIDRHRHFTKKFKITSPIRDYKPEGFVLNEEQFRELAASQERVRPEGALSPCVIQLTPDESSQPLDVKILKNDIRLLQPVRSVCDMKTTVADFLARRTDLSTMMLRLGASRRKNILFLRRVNYVNKQFVQGVYTLAYDEVNKELLVLRTIKKTHKLDLKYWYDLLKFTARENNVVLCGRHNETTLVTPLFSNNLVCVESTLETMLSVKELCIDVMGRSARRIKLLQFLVGKATISVSSKPLPDMMEHERRRLVALYGEEDPDL